MTGRDEDPKEIARRIVRGVLLEWSFDHPDQDTRRWAYKQWLRGSLREFPHVGKDET
jgi:hypothetical protein